MGNKFYKIYSVLCILAAILFYFVIEEYKKNKEIEENLEYPEISYNPEFVGRVEKCSSSASRRETYLIELANKQKFTIYYLGFLQPGDSIYKPAGSDLLYISTKEKESTFDIGLWRK